MKESLPNLNGPPYVHSISNPFYSTRGEGEITLRFLKDKAFETIFALIFLDELN